MSTPNDALASTDGWQLRVLPFMTRTIAGMGLLFFLSSFVQIHLMREELRVSSVSTEQPALTQKLDGAAGNELVLLDGLVSLEHEALRARTQSINAVILRQASLLHLGFLTGMVLCLVGAVFVIGRLQDPVTSLSGEGAHLKASLTTSSPGIVLATLGAALICATLFHRYQFNLPDKAVYIQPASYSPALPDGGGGKGRSQTLGPNSPAGTTSDVSTDPTSPTSPEN